MCGAKGHIGENGVARLSRLRFVVVPGSEMDADGWRDVSSLFSSSYGIYSESSPVRGGERIKLGPGYYERSYATDDYRIALCRDGDRLVAQAIYKELDTARGRVAFVVQLVVDESYRRRGIASTLLHAVWGFSDYYAWGIVTSNAFTVEALESATFRHASAAEIASRSAWLREEVLAGIPFLADVLWTVTENSSVADTRFFTDRSSPSPYAEQVASRLGHLPEGCEWIAVVFREQKLDDFAAYRTMIDASSQLVSDAYARMPQAEQKWAAETESEVGKILEWLPELGKDACICDFGAGTGRHVAEFRKRGYSNVTGIDFAANVEVSDGVASGDCRTWGGDAQFDLILCLYDVIGSFADDGDNEAIVRNIARNLKAGGRAVVSASNFEYLDMSLVGKVDFDDVESSVEKVFAMKPSDIMQSNGEFFDPNYLLVDEKRRLVCHKEQFAKGDGLPGEYLIRDRRYTADELARLFERNGMKVVARHYLRAGFRTEYDAQSGKEILVVATKSGDEGGAA